MRKKMVGLLAACLAVASVGSFTACFEVEKSGLQYTISEDKAYYTVSGIGTETGTDIVIPAQYKGLPVKEIGRNAFSDCSGLKSVVISDGVTSIGKNAFKGCSGLTNIELSNSVTSIGALVFSGCSGLTKIEIPNSVTSIGGNAFYDCSSLQYNEYDNELYLGNANNPYHVLMDIKDTTITEYAINANTKIIYGAFFGCNSLTSIEIPDGVTSIGDSAFNGCSSLASIELPNSVIDIGDGAFYYCNSLTSIEIPKNVKSIGQMAFMDCKKLTSIEIPGGVTRIEAYTFSECHKLKSIAIPVSVTIIDDMALNGCGLESIAFEGTVEQWNAIRKGMGWLSNPETGIFCSDGITSR